MKRAPKESVDLWVIECRDDAGELSAWKAMIDAVYTFRSSAMVRVKVLRECWRDEALFRVVKYVRAATPKPTPKRKGRKP